MNPENDLQLAANTIIEFLANYLVNEVVVCPGSRNAPLTILLSKDKRFAKYSFVDERSAAFFALGLSLKSNKPVAIICTSGSAILNIYPAIAEAFYSNVKLIAISADRPEYLIDNFDGQTIRQKNVLSQHCSFSFNWNYTKKPNSNFKNLNKAFNTLNNKSSPIHLNIPFEEPLYVIKKIDNLEINFEIEEAKVESFESNIYLNNWKKFDRKWFKNSLRHIKNRI